MGGGRWTRLLYLNLRDDQRVGNPRLEAEEGRPKILFLYEGCGWGHEQGSGRQMYTGDRGVGK